jgi:hypothetical protein
LKIAAVPPILFLRVFDELDAAIPQLAPGRLHIIGCEAQVHEPADHLLLPLRRKQHHARLRPRKSQLDPPLLLVERRIGHHAHAELLRIKCECPLLVHNRDADKFHAFNHSVCSSSIVRGDARLRKA